MKQVVFISFLFLLLPVLLFSQSLDSVAIKPDTLIVSAAVKYNEQLNIFLSKNCLLNTAGKPMALVTIEKKQSNHQTIYFYIIAAMALFLAFFKFLYAKYFHNLFRVFFNTSLRQSQLTDQLLQAKLPSLFFNVFFVFIGGSYMYFLLCHFNLQIKANVFLSMLTCVLAVTVIYFTKYLTLKFTGWLTGYKDATNTYIFVVFLINKILGVFLLPFVAIMAFSEHTLAEPIALISLLLVGLMLLLRFVRSYGLLQSRLRVSRLHFFLYIVGIEIIPLLVIYKGLMILLNKNL